MTSDHSSRQDMKKGSWKSLGFLKSWNTHILTAVISFAIGVSLTHYNDFRSRPIISADINSMTIRKGPLSNWEVAIEASFNNTGRSQGFLTVQGCEFKFPMFTDSSFIVKYDKPINVLPGTSILDTISFKLPSSMNDNLLDDFGTLESISVELIDHQQEELISIVKDSSQIISQTHIFRDFVKRNDRDYWTINDKTGDSILVRGQLNLLFEDSIYTNYYLPSTAVVVPRIDNDKIYIEYAQNIDELPFIFIPNEAIRDNIVMGKSANMSLTLKTETKGRFEYKTTEILDLDQLRSIALIQFKSLN